MFDSIKTDWPNHCAPYMDGYTPEMHADFEQYSNHFGDLSTARGNFTSQFGEDGLIQAVFDSIETKTKHCVEIGAADGTFFSNTANLRRQGWSSSLIESNPDLYGKLLQQVGEGDVCRQGFIEISGLDSVLVGMGCPQNPDFLCIDIDGQDFWMWYHLKVIRPRVVLIEHSPYSHDMIPVYGAHGVDGANQATANYLVGLGVAKRYVPICRTFCNVLFVDSAELMPKGDTQ